MNCKIVYKAASTFESSLLIVSQTLEQKCYYIVQCQMSYLSNPESLFYMTILKT